jgi:CRP/FNR family transcriptional regulator, cyclic AMP receptor protein
MNFKIAFRGDEPGLGAVISGSCFEVSAEALEPTVAKLIRREDLLRFLAHQRQAGLHSARLLSEEYKSAFAQARRLALSTSAHGRLASFLLEWGGTDAGGAREMHLTMALTHDNLTSFTATTLETVTRAFGQFQRANLIPIQGVWIHILQPERLSSLPA